MGARHHCRRCGKIFCDQCSGGGYIRRLNAKAEYNAKGVMSVVCRSCFFEGNGWFAEHGSAEWGEASRGHTADRMSDFDRERKVGSMMNIVPDSVLYPRRHRHSNENKKNDNNDYRHNNNNKNNKNSYHHHDHHQHHHQSRNP